MVFCAVAVVILSGGGVRIGDVKFGELPFFVTRDLFELDVVSLDGFIGNYRVFAVSVV